MPTGYTADIANDITFNQYAMQCARAFGALITMRDEPSDAPIPEAFQPSDYHLRAGEDAQRELARLQAMTIEEVQAGAAAAYADAVQSRERAKKERIELRNKYAAMLAEVVQWTPPTPDHESFKEFMASQIRDSMKFDCDTSYYDNPPVPVEPTSWHSQQVEHCRARIAHHARGYQEEVAMTESRNQWVSALRSSLERSS